MPGQGPTEKSSRRVLDSADNLGRKSATERDGNLKKKSWKQTRQAKYKARKPYVRLLEYARRRCSDQDPEGPNYHHYAAKGIRCDLTLNEIAAVWERDKGWLLKRPSLDRIRSEEGYTMFNVRVVEFNLNVRMAWDKSAAVPEPDAAAELA